jgi:hypothetical protein
MLHHFILILLLQVHTHAVSLSQAKCLCSLYKRCIVVVFSHSFITSTVMSTQILKEKKDHHKFLLSLIFER